MTPGPGLDFQQPMDTSWSAAPPHSMSPKHMAKSRAMLEDETQEVRNLPFESAKLKADHFSWTPRCSDGIQAMLAGRQHRHATAFDEYLLCRYSFACERLNLLMTSMGSYTLVVMPAETTLTQHYIQSLRSMQPNAGKLWQQAPLTLR